ncbi:LLM class flavin-dependent oxidoreductase [Streptomyces sp. NPDC093260]|uniref:LLM class flavin-dependent oxidoreductase n=1 Tax=Streptomyces sp. NPDC093260 TaxID=3155073 RepID=UPI00342CC1CB
MSLTFHWFLPTNGDSRHVVGGGHGTPATASGRDRPPTVAYLSQIARAAEDLGFVGALTPTGAWCEDAWLTTAMVSRHTERLKFLVAFRPGFVSPTLAAQMAATFQRHSGGRLLLNVVTGGESHEQRAYGDFLDKDDRYRRTGEFLEVVRRLWDGKTVDLHGEHLRVEDARLARVPDPVPEIYFGGSSPVAGEVAARHVDVYLTWGEPPAQAGLARSESEGQRRMLALHGGSRDGLEVHPNLWAGIGLVRGGAGTALVGGHDEVADRIKEYHALGIDEFVLSGYPHLEEAYWFGEGVLPRLAAQGLWRHPAGQSAAGPAQVPFAS